MQQKLVLMILIATTAISAVQIDPIRSEAKSISASKCSTSTPNPATSCTKQQIQKILANQQAINDKAYTTYVKLLDSIEGKCIYWYGDREKMMFNIQLRDMQYEAQYELDDESDRGIAELCARYAKSLGITPPRYEFESAPIPPGYEKLYADWVDNKNAYPDSIYQIRDQYFLDFYALLTQRSVVTYRAIKTAAINYNKSLAVLGRFSDAYRVATSTTVPHARGDCPIDPSSSSSQIIKNGWTFTQGRFKYVCNNGTIVQNGSVPLEAAYLTCARFNSKTDKGCWVKDNWGKLTWLFNLPMKKPKGQPVSTGSYYTENGYCQVSLYKDFAWTDSCR
jgi:hypothetical protein